MVATVPDDSGFIKRSDAVISVLDVTLLAQGDITFGSNSWRGDAFAPAVWEAIDEYHNSI